VDNFGSVLTFTTTVAATAVKIVIVLTVGTNIVTVDGKATSIDAAPEIVNSRTFVPIRFIAETFGSTVEWFPESRGVTITLGDTTIGLQIGNATAVINGNTIALEAAPYIKNSRTMVPLRVISESFGGDVIWDAALRTITISYTILP
jgi:predicted secreted protein